MRGPLPVSRITLWRLSLEMKRTFEHAVAARAASEPLMVAVELADHTIGFGETHPRPYVSGETTDSVIAAIRGVFVPHLVEIRPANFGEAIEAAAHLPMCDGSGRVIAAARAAVELALLDAYSRGFRRSLESLAGWVSETALGSPGSIGAVRFGGVLSGDSPDRVVRTLRKMRWYGLRDFKLKVGDAADGERLEAVLAALRRPLASGGATLRLDANGAWTLERAIERLGAWEGRPLACVEQPLGRVGMEDWARLARQIALPLMADESLVTAEDAAALIEHRAASWFNIRISKNGGLLPSLRLALAAQEHNIGIQLGCMVGETSILSAAARWFLQLVPGVRFAEGNYGRFLLRHDVVRRPLRFGYGGRWRALSGPGLGVDVAIPLLQQRSVQPEIEIPF